MPTSTVAPVFSTQAPDVLNTSRGVSFSLPILNSGTADASNLVITKISLGTATRLVPLDMPFFIGDVGIDNAISISALFDGSNLIVGSRYLITIRGTYQLDSLTYAFQVNRFIAIPSLVSSPVSYLSASLIVETSSPFWSYTVTNEEVSTSPQFINAFSLDIVALVSVVGTPPGWSVLTDNRSFVLWYAGDTQPPYPHQIAPGQSLAGFRLQGTSPGSESTGFSLTAWNHTTNKAGLVLLGAALSPARAV